MSLDETIARLEREHERSRRKPLSRADAPCPVIGCGRTSQKWHRYCSRHAHRYTRYGDATAVPITYRRHVAPRFSAWIADGYRRWKDHPACIAGRAIASRCLAYTYEPDPSVPRVQSWLATAHVMRHLKTGGITPEQLMLRVAEMAALFDHEPSRCRGQQAELMALGRAVVHLVPWKGAGRGQGKRMTMAVAEHLRDKGLVRWAFAFVKQLNDDQEEEGALAKRAATFD